jgi:UDPglucose 6-dehydrogenase
MRYESAELAKTAINLFLAASVSTANTLAEVCEKIGADWQEIIPSLRLDKRIGQHAYIATGLGLSGGNIERDLKTVSQLGEQHGGNPTIPMAYLEHSHYRKQWPIQHVLSAAKGRTDFKLCVLGLAYKNDTHSTKNSPAITLIEGMPAGMTIVAYDPVVTSLPQHSRVTIAKSAADAMKDADAVCVMTAWEAFKTMDWNTATTTMRGTTLIDPYGLIAPAHAHGFTHRVMGKA